VVLETLKSKKSKNPKIGIREKGRAQKSGSFFESGPF